MPTLEGLRKAVELNQLISKPSEDASANLYKMGKDMGQFFTAQKAGQQYQAGDTQGAMASLMSNPAFAGQIAGNLQNTDPNLANNMEGSKLGALHDYNSTPGDVAEINARAKMNKPALRADKNSPSGFSWFGPEGSTYATQPELRQFNGQSSPTDSAKAVMAPDTSIPTNASGMPAGAPSAAPTPKPIKLQANEEIGSDGNVLQLSPRQLDDIKGIQKTFNTSQKDNIKAINDLSQASDYIDKNIPGSGAIEKLRILKGVVQGRINQQEFAALGKGQGLEATFENAASEAAGKGMGKQTQQDLKDIVNLALTKATGEYDQGLQNAVDTAPGSIDKMVLKKRLAGSGPTMHQALINRINQLPPEDQAAINWAHDNMNDPRAQAILKQFGTK